MWPKLLASGLGSRSGIRFAIDGFVSRPSSTYHQPRAPADRVLYQVVREHFETVRAKAAGVCDGGGLPRFVEEEFEGFPEMRVPRGRVCAFPV
jgi:hypothetical protein